MSGWPPWRRAEPQELTRYIHTGVLATLFPPEIRLPGRSGAPPEIRVRQLFDAFAAAGVGYADEDPGAAGEQDIRAPDQVFLRPGRGNCLDLAVAFAGGCLDAGLHPMIVTLSPTGAGTAGHAVVVVWLRNDLDGAVPYPLDRVVHETPPTWPGMGLRSSWDQPGEFVAVDVARVARGWPPRPDPTDRVGFDEAVAAGAAMLAGQAWVWDRGLDVGLTHPTTTIHPLPGWPKVEPLEPPYHPAVSDGTDPGPLESVRARNQIVPFEPRQALEDLYEWCLAPDSAPGPAPVRLIVVHGVGGSGKTRLAAELAERLRAEQRWYAGFLRRDLTRPGAPTDDLTWLAGVVGPVLLVVDYVEAADPPTLAEALEILAARRSRTVVLLTARFPGEWRTSLDSALGSRGVRVVDRPDTPLGALHPHAEAVYRRAYRRFSPISGAPDFPPDLPSASARWTTLDVVMLGWLAAHHEPAATLPTNRSGLYEQILGREFDNWNAYLQSRFGREADVAALRRAAAVVSLLSPPPVKAVAALRAVGIGELTSLALGEIGGMLGRFLTNPGEDVLALRPDPLADHLITTEFKPGKDFDQCVDLVTADSDDQDGPDVAGVWRLVETLTRSADTNSDVAGALATAVLRRHWKLWPVALAAAWTRGGPFVAPLEELVRREDTPLPLAELANTIPLGHGALRTVALVAAERSTPPGEQGDRDPEALQRAAEALNTLSVRQAEVGDRAGALTSITEAVEIRRALVEVNRAAFLPNLATSLNNLSDLLAVDTDPATAAAAWEDTIAELPATSRSELLCHRSRWRRNRGAETAAAVADLHSAAQLVDLDGPPDEPSAVAHARQQVRTSLAGLTTSELSGVAFPTWATAPIPDSVIDLANVWLSADWHHRQQTLAELDLPAHQDLIRTLATLYCDRPELQQWLDLLADIDARGQDAVFADLDAAQAALTLLRNWIAAPSWNASQTFLAHHPELHHPNLMSMLEEASGDQVARQHLAILRLTEHLPAGEVFDAILDPTDARTLLFHVAHTGDTRLVAEAWFATPHLAAHPFAGPLALALFAALGDDSEDNLNRIDQAARAAGKAASTREWRDTLALLRTLAAARDDRANQLARLAHAFAAEEHGD